MSVQNQHDAYAQGRLDAFRQGQLDVVRKRIMDTIQKTMSKDTFDYYKKKYIENAFLGFKSYEEFMHTQNYIVNNSDARTLEKIDFAVNEMVPIASNLDFDDYTVRAFTGVVFDSKSQFVFV